MKKVDIYLLNYSQRMIIIVIIIVSLKKISQNS